MQLKRAGILNDIHFPFEDKSRYAAALKIFRTAKLDYLYLNGDIGEFLSWSTHPKHPLDQTSALAEITYINKRFDEAPGTLQGGDL